MPCWYFGRTELGRTPTLKAGVDIDTEAKYRREGAKLIIEAGTALGLRYDVCATGVVYFHRFYVFYSFIDFHRYVTASCCLLLAAKVDESLVTCDSVVKTVENLLTTTQFAMFGSDPKQELLITEKILLESLKFDLIVEHPYTFLLRFIKLFKGDQDTVEQLLKMAWTFVNDSLCTMLCIQWEPDLIAISLLYLSCRLLKFDVTDWVDKPVGFTGKWYQFFLKDATLDIIEDVCREVLDLYAGRRSQHQQNSPLSNILSAVHESCAFCPGSTRVFTSQTDLDQHCVCQHRKHYLKNGQYEDIPDEIYSKVLSELNKQPRSQESRHRSLAEPSNTISTHSQRAAASLRSAVKQHRSRSPAHKSKGHSRSPILQHKGCSISPVTRHKGRSKSPVLQRKGHSRSPVSKRKGHSKSPISQRRGHSRSRSQCKGYSKSSLLQRKGRSRSPVSKRRANSKSPISQRKGRSRSRSQYKSNSQSFLSQHKDRSRSPLYQHKERSRSPVSQHKSRSRSRSTQCCVVSMSPASSVNKDSPIKSPTAQQPRKDHLLSREAFEALQRLMRRQSGLPDTEKVIVRHSPPPQHMPLSGPMAPSAPLPPPGSFLHRSASPPRHMLTQPAGSFPGPFVHQYPPNPPTAYPLPIQDPVQVHPQHFVPMPMAGVPQHPCAPHPFQSIGPLPPGNYLPPPHDTMIPQVLDPTWAVPQSAMGPDWHVQPPFGILGCYQPQQAHNAEHLKPSQQVFMPPGPMG